jgi:hypothetical protein
VGLAALRVLDRRKALLFLAVIVGLNAVVLLALNVLTEGWELYINFEMSTRHALGSLYGRYITEGLQSTALALAFVGITWLAWMARGARSWRRSSMRQHPHPTGRRVLLLAMYAPLGFAMAVYFMRKQGSGTNQFVGVAWALGLFAAGGWRIALRHTGTATVAGACVILSFPLALLHPLRRAAAKASVGIPQLENAVHWGQIPPELRAWAAHHTLYSSVYPDLNVPNGGPLYPDFVDFADLLAAGNQPLYLVHALLNRRFEGVELIDEAEDPYTSAYGKWEENYLWKLDRVISARYAAEPGLPQGLLGRRPGPEQDSWMRDCFGPFAAGGASFRIHRGGGFWCLLSAGELQLVEAPVPLSEVVTTQPVRVGGTITLDFDDQPPYRIALVLEDDGHAFWTARVAAPPRSPHELLVSTYSRGSLLGSTLVSTRGLPSGLRSLQLRMTPTQGNGGRPLAAGTAAVAVPVPAQKAAFAMVATSGVDVDLRAARLEH